MTEKRFVERYAGRTIKKLIGIEDIETNRVCVTIEENIHLLNELADENKELKEENEQLKQQIEELSNNQLRLQNSTLMKQIGEYSRRIKELEKRREEKSCGTCKYFQLVDQNGIFRMWCNLGRDWKNVKYCSDWER